MNRTPVSVKILVQYGVLALTCFALGFAGSLLLHWSLRPTSAVAGQTIANATLEAADGGENSLRELRVQNDSLKATVGALEVKLDRQSAVQSINEGHARVLVSELQAYRQDRDRLFAELQARNQRLLNKIDELDQQITRQLELRAERDIEQDHYALQAELTSLLSYPHALNEQALLNAALIEQPVQNREFVQQRFELMMQQERYDLTDQVYDLLTPLHAQLNDLHGYELTINWVHCTGGGCEVQVHMRRLEPYFDYAQQWLDEVLKLPLLRQERGHAIYYGGDSVWVALQTLPETGGSAGQN